MADAMNRGRPERAWFWREEGALGILWREVVVFKTTLYTMQECVLHLCSYMDFRHISDDWRTNKSELILPVFINDITSSFSKITNWSLGRAPTWRLHTKLYKFGSNTFPNYARMKNCTDLNHGKVVYISITYHIPVSWVNLMNGYGFYFWLHDRANRGGIVTARW